MKRITTGDKTWVYEYDIQTSQQSWEWRLKNELKSKKENSPKELQAIHRSAYEKRMDDWAKRRHSCIALDGAYFEGGKINFDKSKKFVVFRLTIPGIFYTKCIFKQTLSARS